MALSRISFVSPTEEAFQSLRTWRRTYRDLRGASLRFAHERAGEAIRKFMVPTELHPLVAYQPETLRGSLRP